VYYTYTNDTNAYDTMVPPDGISDGEISNVLRNVSKDANEFPVPHTCSLCPYLESR
jgi:hypothetical protein